MNSRTVLFVCAAISAELLASCSSAEMYGGSEELAMKNPLVAEASIEVHRDAGCGCCVSWADYLRKHGAGVEVIVNEELEFFRTEQGVTEDAASCHTALVEGYVVEGHVPVPAIQRLLETRPDARGIAMPGMPAKSPGMGGNETDWEQLEVMLINNDGSLSPWEF